MARKLSTTKDKLIPLLNAIDAVPSAKLGTDVGKHLGFRKALKKILQDYIDAQSDITTKFQEKRIELSKKITEIKDPKDEEAKDALTKQRDKALESANKELEKLLEGIKPLKVAIDFDNEDFNYAKRVITDNATAIFKRRDETFDADRADIVFDLINSVE